MSELIAETRGRLGLLTLNRPKALNALSLPMVRGLRQALQDWRDDPQVLAVAVRGMGKDGPFGAFCAGGDIRFFHQAALAGDPALEDFFTEEYSLNHLIHTYPKPYIALMDGVVMGGGMGISQGASVRVVTERSRLAMPETLIGLFPDVGGGYFLSRCPGRVGEYLALTGVTLGGQDALALGLADGWVDTARLPVLWELLASTPFESGAVIEHRVATYFSVSHERPVLDAACLKRINQFFALDSVSQIVQALEADASDWAQTTARLLRQRSPLMLHVALAQIRRARHMGLVADLRMERDLMRHSLHPQHLDRSCSGSEAVEGIRALVVDKDQQPAWRPARIEDVSPAMWEPFFTSPWPAHAHPLRDLG
jgi:enoyl-CoA hydratase